MTLPLILFIVFGFVLALILAVRFFELKTGRHLLGEKVRFSGDKLIRNSLLAVFRNVVRIKKFLVRETLLLPKRFLRLTHFIWQKIKHKIDRFYDKVHRHR